MSSDHLVDRRYSDSIDITHTIGLERLDGPPWTPSTISTLNTEYAPVQERESDSDTESLKPGEHHAHHALHHWESERPSRWKTVIIQLFAFLWLVPIVTLLILNIKRHIIGASAWCPGGHCYPSIYGHTSYKEQIRAAELPAKYDRESHNLVGALQFVAKALEVWFILIASWLVYLITTKIAGMSAGLPIGYFTRASEFDKIPSLFDPLLWTTLRRLPASRSSARRARRRIWLFIAFTIFLCIICNLMGPAVAVLVIPTLQWIDTQRHVEEAFAFSNSALPPSLYSFAFRNSNGPLDDCNSAQFVAQNYSCASSWAASLDSWVESYGASQNSEHVVSIQSLVSFTYNTTASVVGEEGPTNSKKTVEAVTWSPNRQVLNSLSLDLELIALLSANSDLTDSVLEEAVSTYKEYNSTVQTIIQRNGPILGALANVWLGFDDQKVHTIELDPDRWIKCYEDYDIVNTPMCWGDCGMEDFSPVSGTYTRCIPIGAGWEDGYKTTNFTIPRQWVDEDTFRPEVQVTVHASSKAAFVSDDDPSPILPRECLTGETSDRCEWDRLWEKPTDPKILHRSETVNTVEMVWDTTGIQGNWTLSNTTIVTDFVAFQAFANYSLDPSIQENPLFTVDWVLDVRENSTLDSADAISLDPSWILATWATWAGGNISDRAGVGLELRSCFRNIFESHLENDTTPEIISDQKYRLNKVALMPIIQTLGLVDFNTTTASATDVNDDPKKPLLYRYGRINVYAYGLSSRTSWVGVIVTSIGCVIVLVEVTLGLHDRRRFRSMTQMLVAALEHTYTDEFPDTMRHDEKNISRVSFRLSNNPDTAGKFKFEKRI